MMRLGSLSPATGAVKQRKRLGRGQASGKGGTCTRGHKGAKSRSGNAKKLGFEGGQMPLQRRVPKMGFKNPHRKEYIGINLDTLQSLSDAGKFKEVVVDRDLLSANGLIGKNDLVKILGRGELKVKLKVIVHKFSKTAAEAIQRAGGEIITL